MSEHRFRIERMDGGIVAEADTVEAVYTALETLLVEDGEPGPLRATWPDQPNLPPLDAGIDEHGRLWFRHAHGSWRR